MLDLLAPCIVAGRATWLGVPHRAYAVRLALYLVLPLLSLFFFCLRVNRQASPLFGCFLVSHLSVLASGRIQSYFLYVSSPPLIFSPVFSAFSFSFPSVFSSFIILYVCRFHIRIHPCCLIAQLSCAVAFWLSSLVFVGVLSIAALPLPVSLFFAFSLPTLAPGWAPCSLFTLRSSSRGCFFRCCAVAAPGLSPSLLLQRFLRSCPSLAPLLWTMVCRCVLFFSLVCRASAAVLLLL